MRTCYLVAELEWREYIGELVVVRVATYSEAPWDLTRNRGGSNLVMALILEKLETLLAAYDDLRRDYNKTSDSLSEALSPFED